MAIGTFKLLFFLLLSLPVLLFLAANLIRKTKKGLSSLFNLDTLADAMLYMAVIFSLVNIILVMSVMNHGTEEAMSIIAWLFFSPNGLVFLVACFISGLSGGWLRRRVVIDENSDVSTSMLFMMIATVCIFLGGYLLIWLIKAMLIVLAL